MSNKEQLLTIKDTAKRMQVSKITVWRALQKGFLSGIKVGRIWRIREEDLQKFIRERRT